MRSFDRKLFAGVVFITALILPMLGAAVYCLHKVVVSQRNFIDKYGEQLGLVKDLRRDLTEQRASVASYVLSGTGMALDGFRRAHSDFLVNFEHLSKLVSNPSVRKDLDDIARLEGMLYSAAKPGISLKEAGSTTAEVNEYFREHTVGHMRELNASLDDFVANTTTSFEKAKAENENTSQRVVRILALASILVFCLCLAAATMIFKLVRKKKAVDEMNELLLEKEKQLSSARKETVEVVAHDLKNPLASIIMCTQLGLSRHSDRMVKSPEQAREFFQVILRSAESMKNLIDSLLDHAKIEAGSLVLNKSERDFTSLIRLVVNRFEPMARKNNIELSCDLPDNLAPLTLDPVRIEQVVSNLISNALKFTTAGGKILVALSVHNGFVLTSVSDTGCGLSDEQVEHVFDRYWQVKETAGHGNGLGLAISRAIVAAHNGRIWVESEAGMGSTFFFSIPFEPAIKPVPTVRFSSQATEAHPA